MAQRVEILSFHLSPQVAVAMVLASELTAAQVPQLMAMVAVVVHQIP